MKQPIDTTPTIAGLVPVLLHLYVILSMISQVAVAAPSQIYKNNDEQHQHQRQVQVLMLHSNAPNSHNQTTTSLLEPSQLATHLIVDRSDILSKSSTNSTSDRHINNNNSNSEYDAPQLSALRLYGHESITSSDATNFQQPKDNQPSPAQPMPHVSEVTMTKFRPTWYSANRFNDLISSNAQTSSVNGSNVRAVPMLANMVPGDYIQQKAFDSPILLRTRLGVIEGVRSIRLGQKRLYTFLSIPYAKPPIGERRFAAPEPVEPWQGILQATSWPPFCVQTSMTLASRKSPVHVISTHMNEDCLYLNVWTPTLKYRKGRNRPVMVWLHGGAFQYGGISVDENDGSTLALIGDVVVVTLNYRLNAFGFLNPNTKSAPNNVGLLDQRLALEWVRDNIRWFGGNPDQVTLFGESAGGHSVGLHLISPRSFPLFKRAIFQSGVPTSFLRSYDTRSGDSPAINLARQLGCLKSQSTATTITSTQAPDTTNKDLPTETAIVKNITAGSIDRDQATSVLTEELQVSPHQRPGANTLPGLPASEDRLARSTASQNETFEASRSVSISETISRLSRRSANAEITASNDNAGGGDTEAEAEDDKADGTMQEEAPNEIDEQILECMRSKSAIELLRAMGAPGTSGFFPNGDDPDGFFPNGPIMDSLNTDNLQIGPQKDFLFGVNPDEGTFMIHYAMPAIFPSNSEPTVENLEQLKLAVGKEISRADALDTQQQHNKNLSVAAKKSISAADASAHSHLFKPLLRTSSSMLQNFMSKSMSASDNNTLSAGSRFGRAIGGLITDIIFLCPARAMATTLADSGRNVYFYVFNHRSSQSQWHPWLGITHHDEVEFVFGRPIRSADTYSGADIEMSRRIIKTWAHFASTGQMLSQNSVTWPKYGVEDNNYLEMRTNSARVGSRMHDKFCNVYDTIISVHLQDK